MAERSPTHRGGAPDPRSGVAADGSWSPTFEGQRPPFERGNDVGVRFETANTAAVTHGAYANVDPRAAEIAETLRLIAPAYREADEPLIRLTAGVLARIEAASLWIGEHGIFRDGNGAELQPVLRVLSVWENSASRFLGMLGCAPTTRAQLGLDVARTQQAESLVDLAARARREAEVDGAVVEEQP